jgi:MFS family permease
MLINLLKNPTIRRLSLVQLIVYFGSWFSNVAIYTMILHFGVDPITNALVVSMYALPALLAPLNGAIIDKLPLRRFMLVLMATELVITLLYLTIHDISQVYMLMALIFLRTIAAFLFFNAEMSLLPQLFKGETLKQVNELHSIIWSLTYALGMALGGIAVDRFGIYNTILIDVALFAVGIWLFSGIKLHLAPKTTHSIGKLIRDGFHYLKSHTMLLHLIVLHSVVAFTSFDALINLLTESHYSRIIAIPLAIGWLNAIRAVGLMIGPFVLSRFVNHQNLHYFFFAQGAMIIIWAFVEHSFTASLIMMLGIGFFTTTLWSFTYTLIQTTTDKAYLGRIVAYNDMIFMLVSIIITLFIGGAYAAGMTLQSITLSLGLGFVVGGFYYKWFRTRFKDLLQKEHAI